MGTSVRLVRVREALKVLDVKPHRRPPGGVAWAAMCAISAIGIAAPCYASSTSSANSAERLRPWAERSPPSAAERPNIEFVDMVVRGIRARLAGPCSCRARTPSAIPSGRCRALAGARRAPVDGIEMERRVFRRVLDIARALNRRAGLGMSSGLRRELDPA